VQDAAAHSYLSGSIRSPRLLSHAPYQLSCVCSFIKASLGGPTPAEYETLRAERDALASELTIAKQTIAELQAKVSTSH
jgi:hypothetical protein